MISARVAFTIACDFCEQELLDRDGVPLFFDSRADAFTFEQACLDTADWLLINGQACCNRCWTFDEDSDERKAPCVS